MQGRKPLRLYKLKAKPDYYPSRYINAEVKKGTESPFRLSSPIYDKQKAWAWYFDNEHQELIFVLRMQKQAIPFLVLDIFEYGKNHDEPYIVVEMNKRNSIAIVNWDGEVIRTSPISLKDLVRQKPTKVLEYLLEFVD